MAKIRAGRFAQIQFICCYLLLLNILITFACRDLFIISLLSNIQPSNQFYYMISKYCLKITNRFAINIIRFCIYPTDNAYGNSHEIGYKPWVYCLKMNTLFNIGLMLKSCGPIRPLSLKGYTCP